MINEKERFEISEHLEEYYKNEGYEIYEEMPEGYSFYKNPCVFGNLGPYYRWIYNGKSVFSGERKFAILVVDREAHKRQVEEYKKEYEITLKNLKEWENYKNKKGGKKL